MIKKKLLNKLVIEGMYLNIIKAAYDKPIPSKRNCQQNNKSTYGVGENICKSYI